MHSQLFNISTYINSVDNFLKLKFLEPVVGGSWVRKRRDG